MMFFGFAEILMLAVLSGGFGDTDLVSLVQPTHYFKSRQMELSVDRAIDYALDEPTTGKAQIIQLSALRYLADEADALRKSPKYAGHRKALEAIAQGKKAQDAQGFAKDYAGRVLMKLDGTKPAVLKPAPIRLDTLSWFPANVTIAGAVDLRRIRQNAGPGADPIKELIKVIPEPEKVGMYEFFEKSGNIRLERASFAYTSSTGKGNGDGKIYLRVTGKSNHDWVVDMIRAFDRGRLQVTKSKDDKDTPITILQAPNDPPAIMLVGNTDILIVGNERRQQGDLTGEVLDARSKKKPTAASGNLKASLAKVPDSAVALLVGDVPEELRRELGFVFNPLPTNIVAFVERTKEGLDVQASTSMPAVDDADKMVRRVAELRQQGIEELKKQMQQPRRPGEPPIPFQSLVNVMESLQVQSKNESVQVRVVVPDLLIRELTSGMMLWGSSRRDLVEPPKKADEKK